ncbi:MAG: hypothetical protein CSA18_04950, partial [Deltaproteobacteria bacterium]
VCFIKYKWYKIRRRIRLPHHTMPPAFLKKRTFFSERETVTNIGTYPHLIFLQNKKRNEGKRR